ncbi:F-box/kelch-repeat protein [Thalictrum thalictroides]|uniref:F-box/kelch-repeat protein n=1 Tax=Thalictrum thalictroides TaxID=46969 RepID=A0A7J6VN77_THATH|nr:F-box/kelch-repeat protein [Thalictrum thalictroides]
MTTYNFSKRKGDQMEFIPGLPEDIGLECLTRLQYTTHRVASRVCHQWRDLLESRDFYNHRKKSGFTRKLACLVQSLPIQQPADSKIQKPITPSSFGITVFDPNNQSWDRLSPIPKYPFGLPLFSQLCSMEGKLVVMGGWNPVSWQPVKDVFIYDFTTQQWKQGKDMPSKRSFFAAAALDGLVFIAGGHDENKNALKSAWTYDVRRDEWTELTQMSEERDECEGVVIESEFCVVSGYGTEEQGKFRKCAEFYDVERNEWRKDDEVWIQGKCPRGCVGVNRLRGKSLICLAELDSSEVRFGTCGVKLGEFMSLVTGSAYQGTTQGFYTVVNMNDRQNCKLTKIEMEDDFSGFVQSGCCVEV